MIKNHKKSLVYIEQLKQSLGEINHELSLENQKILQFESKTDLTKEEKSQTMTEKEREKIR